MLHVAFIQNFRYSHHPARLLGVLYIESKQPLVCIFTLCCEPVAQEGSALILWCCLQIHSSIQHATLMVHSYPKPVDCNKLLEVLAQKHSEPSINLLLNRSEVDDLQHAANWETVRSYIESSNPENVHVHCPLIHRPTGSLT